METESSLVSGNRSAAVHTGNSPPASISEDRTRGQIYDSNTYHKGYTYLGLVGEIEPTDGHCPAGCICTEQRNKFSVGETIEVMKPDGSSPAAKVLAIYDGDGNSMESAPHPKQKLYVKLDVAAEPLDVLRRKD